MGANNQFQDLTGQQFGDLVALEYLGDRKWRCACRKGHITDVSTYSLTSGRSSTCKECKTAPKKVEIGDKFGEWTVVGIKDSVKVICSCSCNKNNDHTKFKAINKYTLLDGRSTNCGHLKNKDRIIDMRGQRFGKLVVREYINEQRWLCDCDCGGTKIAHRNHLLDGRTTHCDECRAIKHEDLTGQRFGKLVAKEYIGNKTWLCECDCTPGKLKPILSANLKNGSTVSCGCLLNYFSFEEMLDVIVRLTDNLGRAPYKREVAEALNINEKAADYFINTRGLREYISMEYSSEAEREIASLVSSNGKVVLGDKTVLNGYELDIYLPEHKLAIEYNGTYWHSTKQKKPDYHKDKTDNCERKGIQLIHIFEHEWSDIRKKNILIRHLNRLLNTASLIKIPARKTVVGKIPNKLAKEFLDNYHLQKGVDSDIHIGCYLDDKLYGVMTFGKPRFSKEAEYELLRLCWHPDYAVVGGAEKLFSYFIQNYNPKDILTYVDRAKFTGDVYKRLGFEFLENTKPNYCYIGSYNGEVVSRYKATKKALIERGWGTEEQSESEIMDKHGYYKIYDSGNAKYIWSNQEF